MRESLLNHQVDVKKICLVMLVLAISPSLLLSLEVKAQVDYYHKDFKWSYKGYEWTFSLEIPKSLYDSYKKVPVSTRTRKGLAGYGFLTTTNDPYLHMVAGKLKEAASREGFDTHNEVSFALAFVQSLPYTSDSVTSRYDEYPRFPIETLVDGGGDCEDTAILFATITLIMNYSTVYISPPEHYAVGIWGKDLPGYYYTYNNKNYYYCETTGDGFEIGEIPSEYKDIEVYIYEINEYQQYRVSSDDNTKPRAYAGSDQTVNEDTPVEFDGSASSDNVGIVSYTWTFTDVTTKTLIGVNPSYSFGTPGIYTITLEVEDAAGNGATDTVVITVLDVTKPVANAGQDRTANVGASVSFDAGASSDNVGIVSYDWDFGDGTTGTGETTTHAYASAGTYTVTLTARDAAGNSAAKTATLTVHPAEDVEGFPLWTIGVIIAAIAILIAVILLWRR